MTGPQTIEVAVSDEVAAVELRLDDELIAEIRRPPWRTVFDFGQDLHTQELAAIARDQSGEEISRAVQLLNVPRPHVEVEVLLEEWVDGSPTVARLVWHSAQASKPVRTTISLDGSVLSAEDSSRIELPRLDPQKFHFLAAELAFTDQESASVEVVFGGGYGAAVQTELTAVPVRIESRKLRSLEAPSGWLRHKSGSELSVVAVDEGAAEIAIVREDAALPALSQLALEMKWSREFKFKTLRLGPRDRLRFVSTRPSASLQPGIRYSVFPVSEALGPHHGTVPALLAGVSAESEGSATEELTNAIAVAGRLGVEGQKRRATVVLVADCARVGGRYRVDAVRSYLAELHVPLVVWQVGRGKPDPGAGGLCEEAEEIRTPRHYHSAFLRLRKLLEQQRILWIRGQHLPRYIEVAPGIDDVTLAGR